MPLSLRNLLLKVKSQCFPTSTSLLSLSIEPSTTFPSEQWPILLEVNSAHEDNEKQASHMLINF